MYGARFSRKVACDGYHPVLPSGHIVGDPSWYLHPLLPDPSIYPKLELTRHPPPFRKTIKSVIQSWTQLGWSFSSPSDVRFYHARMTQKVSRGSFS